MIGAVAAGHEQTAQAAASMLSAGGNAYDAALAALCAACVAEPVLASLGGGGFLLAHPAGQDPVVYDFFVQTPVSKHPSKAVDFRPIQADFGDASQEFHIGLGAAATPGAIKGLFLIHRELCRLPLDLLIQPARELAIAGAQVNTLQHYISTVVEPILRCTPAAFALHRSPGNSGQLAGVGEQVPMPGFADSLEALAREGGELFYRGEMGAALIHECRVHGGHLSQADLSAYRVIKRKPLQLRYRQASLLTNPPPALGGLLIGLSLALLRNAGTAPQPWGGPEQLLWTARAMQSTQMLRKVSRLHERSHQLSGTNEQVDSLLREHEQLLTQHPINRRGTTQLSILDAQGNLASMTLSNGEGCGYVVPGTDIMINNMLGEEDLNPHGFHQWPENRRIASMMSPSALELDNGTRIATGSGGSNRIRSAILQVVCNLMDYNMDVHQAVESARIHYESGLLNLEPPRSDAVRQHLQGEFPRQCLWSEPNLFFGGAHTVIQRPDGSLDGVGDPRRGGVFISI